jgi:para-nitrobenzyl esterase
MVYALCGNSLINLKLSVTGGLIEGSAEGDLKKYLGIPYAEPPVGDLRWSPPQPLNAWSGIKDASVNSNICYQPN